MYTKYFVETLGERSLAAQFRGGAEEGGSVVAELVHGIMAALVSLAVNEATYAVYTELIKTLLVAFSTQLYSPPGNPCSLPPSM